MAKNFKNPWESNTWGQGSEEFTRWLPEDAAYFTGVNPNTGESVKDRDSKNSKLDKTLNRGGIHRPIKAITIYDQEGSISKYRNAREQELAIIFNELQKVTGIKLKIDEDDEYLSIDYVDTAIGSTKAREKLNSWLIGSKNLGIVLKDRDSNEFVNADHVSSKPHHGFIKSNYKDGFALINLEARKGLKFVNMSPDAFNLGFGIMHELLHSEYKKDYYTKLADQRTLPGPTEDEVNTWRREMNLPERQTYGWQYDDTSNPDYIIMYIEFKDVSGNKGRVVKDEILKSRAKVVTEPSGYRYIKYF
ncbi:hypothetical protein [Chryseobacterium mulctrae]|uniref:hypothetical protein n=1 Tax=Chryseobacterium mulctrae TaxID=2576777 RepID=UPI001116FC9A|nr:hypothetical protein [Chryseobacterium mulctrae]